MTLVLSSSSSIVGAVLSVLIFPPLPPPPPPGKKEDIDKLVKVRDEQIRSVLQAAQYKKYLDLEKTMRPPMPGQDKKAAPPPVNK